MPDYDNNMRCGLWIKESQKGLKYLSGMISIDGKEYWVSLFDNAEKQRDNPKAPRHQMVLKPKEGGGY